MKQHFIRAWSRRDGLELATVQWDPTTGEPLTDVLLCTVLTPRPTRRVLLSASMISSRILRVSGRINGSSKFQIRSLSANKDAVQGHTAERHAQAVLPPRTNRQQPGIDPGWKIFGAAVAIAAGCLSVYAQSKPVVRDVQSYLPSFLERSVASTIALDTLLGYGIFIPRLVEQNEISSILERTEADGKYFVVYGAKGAGKSLIVDQSTKDHSGVIKLMVTSITTKDDIVKSLAKRCGVANETTPDIADFVTALSKGAIARKLLTVIFEVERGGAPGDEAIGVQAVRSLAKEFAAVSNCIIILSETETILEFGRDHTSEKFIFINGFTEVEARDFLERQKLNITESEITGVFARIGTSPAMLVDLSDCVQNDGYTVERFVEKVLEEARTKLACFPLKPILKALKEHPEGVSPEFFNNMEYKGVDLSNPQAVGYAMKRYHAIVYRIENGKYQLLSKAHETALQTYEPIIVA